MLSIARLGKVLLLLAFVGCGIAPQLTKAALLSYTANPDIVHAGAWQPVTVPSVFVTPPRTATVHLALLDAPRRPAGGSPGYVALAPEPSINAVRRIGVASQAKKEQGDGLGLPEPDYGSALVATLALAAFFFLRRSIS